MFTKAADQYMDCPDGLLCLEGLPVASSKEEHKVNDVFPSPERSLAEWLVYVTGISEARI